MFAAGGKDNEPWSSSTPSGHLKMTISNPDAMGRFGPGKHYRIVITEFEEHN